VASLVQTDTIDGIRLIQADNPPVNALGDPLQEALHEAVGDADRDTSIDGIVIMGAGRTFIAGADIKALEAHAWDPRAPKPELRPIITRVERCRKPVVMAIHGVALGGGLELAMGGHYRVALGSARLGLPECTLGVIPGAEGTQRLPRLAGVAKALEMIVTSEPIDARDALAHGIVDEVVDDDLTGAAVRLARRAAESGGPHPVASQRRDRLGTMDANCVLFDEARSLARRLRPGQPAPLLAIDAVEAATEMPFAEGSAREEQLFLESLRSEAAKALIHVFFAERATRKKIEVPDGNLPAAVARLLEACRAEVQRLTDEGTTRGQLAASLARFGMTREVLGERAPEGLDVSADADPRTVEPPPAGTPVERLVYALINEGARILDDGRGCAASDIDVMAITSCGFPRWRGGPLFYADRLGLDHVLERLSALRHELGAHWRPAPLLERVTLARGTLSAPGR
jgi:enoyl-CoA hydratase/carnithine racemase